MTENSNTSACPNTRDVIIMGKNTRKQQAIFFHPSCGSWSCDVCWEKNRDHWRQVGFAGALKLHSQGAMLQFITLTGRGYFTPYSSIHFFRENWPRLRKRIAYLNDQWKDVTQSPWAYFLIPERHQSGRAHWHLICSTWQDKPRWWKDNAYECGLGYIDDIKPIEHPGLVAGYVTKYMLKDAGGVSWPKNFRRARVGGAWPVKSENLPTEWQYQAVSEKTKWIEKGAYLDMGWQVIDKTEES